MVVMRGASVPSAFPGKVRKPKAGDVIGGRHNDAVQPTAKSGAFMRKLAAPAVVCAAADVGR